MSSINEDSSREVFQFPDCWKNDERMNVLFAPFRSKAINPTDWESKMKFWELLIDRWCKYYKRPLVTQSELINEFQRNGKTPTCLPDVVNNLVENGVLISKDSFSQMTEQSWKNWAVKVVVTNPLKWTINKIKSAVISSDLSDNHFIHLPTIKHLGEQLLQLIPADQQGKLLDVNLVFKFSGMHSMEELNLVLQWLQSRKKIAVVRGIQPVDLVKFPKNGVLPVKVSEADTGIFLLEKHETTLKMNIEKLEKEKEEALNEARKYVVAKMKPMAKHSLRKKKELEKFIEQRANALSNIQALLYKIQQAETDSEVLESYKIGISALKQTFKSTGLSETNAINTMDELEDVLDTHNEIESTLSRSIEPGLDSDLEQELEDLLRADSFSFPPDNPSDGDFRNKSSIDLPDVPSNDPSSTVTDLEDRLLELRLKGLSS